ncbi:MAG: prolipoprotein diacylglyceryl transferase, partial [Muribaculaceae bacterium]|nr:prolipoprotein diacylglyceryl transferase [Muribaculaceae bacterium]
LITGIFSTGICLPRYLIEYVKNVQVQSEYEMIARYGMNLGQMLSIPFILLGVGLVIWALSHPRQHWTFPNKFAEELPKQPYKAKH